VVIDPTSYLNQYYPNYDIFNFNICTWEKPLTTLFLNELIVLKYITFEHKNIDPQSNFSSSLDLVNKSFIDLKSYEGCGEERECLYVHVKNY
jgi:hypothetical protein